MRQNQPRVSSCAHILIISLVLSALPVLTAPGQTQAINGSIRGRVIDAASAPVAQATVKIENTQTGFTRTGDTGEDGYYVFPNLLLGSGPPQL